MMTKMRGEPCNFCEFPNSRYGCGSKQSLQDQDNDNDNEAVLREKVQQLRSLLMKMTGRDDDATFTELQALKSRLLDARRIVLDQKKKKELEEEDEQKKKAARREVSVPCKSSTSSTENRQEKQDNGALMSKLERSFKRRKSESLQRKFERLWLFNERMNGRQIESMNSRDLLLLDAQILLAMNGLMDQMRRPLEEQVARQRGQ